ncbi:hypothetical protein HO291_003426 [Salmonella enterica]|nr:hypothetical protein [Salmonella enterica]
MMQKKSNRYADVNPHEFAELYRKLEILRPVTIPDQWQRKQFRALDVCQVCDGDTMQVLSRSYAYGPILPPDDELEDWPKFTLRNRRLRDK